CPGPPGQAACLEAPGSARSAAASPTHRVSSDGALAECSCGADPGDFFFDLGFQIVELLLSLCEVLLRTLDVLALLHRPRRAPCGGGAAVDRGVADLLAPEDGGEDRGAGRYRGLQARAPQLSLFALDDLRRAARLLLCTMDLRRVFLAQCLDGGAAFLARVLIFVGASHAIGLGGGRGGGLRLASLHQHFDL